MIRTEPDMALIREQDFIPFTRMVTLGADKFEPPTLLLQRQQKCVDWTHELEAQVQALLSGRLPLKRIDFAGDHFGDFLIREA
jgi:hypothetical protein